MLFLSKHINYHQIRIKVLSLIMSKKRVSVSLPFFKIGASLTVEAAIVLPVFLFYMMTILYTLEIVRFQSNVWEALHQISTEEGFLAYERYYGKENGDSLDVAQEVHHYLMQQTQPYLCVKNKENGIRVSKIQNYGGTGNIRISVVYEVIPFIRWLSIGEILFEDSCLMHSFTGYTGNIEAGEKNGMVYVYITPSGEKYHYAENCTYLKVQTMKADKTEMGLLRNASGEKYHECEICTTKEQGTVFYTKWGNRYHGKGDCYALRKTIYIVPVLEVQNREECTKCKEAKIQN